MLSYNGVHCGMYRRCWAMKMQDWKLRTKQRSCKKNRIGPCLEKRAGCSARVDAACIYSGLLAILAKNIAIAIAILGGNSIAILSAILYFKSVLQYYCNTFCNTPSRACAHIQHGTGSHCQLCYYKWKPR